MFAPFLHLRMCLNCRYVAGSVWLSRHQMSPPRLRIREAEHAGVQQVWMTQSVGMLDTLTLFAAVAAHTTRIRLGTSIVPIYPRHPLVMALQAVTVDALAPGRLRLGVGTSHRHVMENVYGLSMPSPLAYLREYVEVIRQGLWEGRVDHQGTFFKVVHLTHARHKFLCSSRHWARRHFVWLVKLLMARFRGCVRFPIYSIQPYLLYGQGHRRRIDRSTAGRAYPSSFECR